jgi:hypothetical protein
LSELYAKNLYYIPFSTIFFLVVVAPKKHPETTASSTVPKNDNAKAGSSYPIKETPKNDNNKGAASYSDEEPPQNTKSGMLTRSHNQDNIRLGSCGHVQTRA